MDLFPAKKSMKIGTVYLILLIFLCNCLGRNPEDSLWRRGYNVSWTGFAEAIDKGDTEALELFFKAGYDSWTPTWVLQHRQFLRSAIGKGHTDVFFLLVSEGAEIHGMNSDGHYLIHAAARDGRPQILKYLIDQGQDVNASGLHSETGKAVVLPPLMAALVRAYSVNISEKREKDFYEVCQLLLSHGANPNWQDPGDGLTPLYWTVLNRDLRMTKLLIRYGAEPTLPAYEGNTPLVKAACHDGSLDLVQTLLKGIDGGPRSRMTMQHSFQCARSSKIRSALLKKLEG